MATTEGTMSGGVTRRVAPAAAAVTFATMLLGLAALWLILLAPAAWAGKALSGTMSVNGGSAYTASTAVTLTSQVRGAKLMRFKNADGSYSAWETYASTKSWDLGQGDGPKRVEAQYKGSTGSRAVLYDDIVLDTTGPVTSSDYDGVPRRVVTVTLTAVDASSGVASTWHRLDGGAWVKGARKTLCRSPKRNGLAGGTHTLEFYAIDVLGNVGATGSVVVVLQ